MAGHSLPQLDSRTLNGGGRPSKFTPEVKGKLIQAIRLGNHISTSCAYAGITSVTFNNWYRRGERVALMEDQEGLSEMDLDYFAFYEAITEAQAASEMTALAAWRSQMSGDWKAARDFLARRHPERWGAKVEVNVTHTDEQILSLLEELDEGDPPGHRTTPRSDGKVIETSSRPALEETTGNGNYS